ncbi:hypothetical protein SLE2022_140340 [Rubroshorea leprosula]
MNILSWNCQGLGQALTKRALKDLLFKYSPCLVVLMETRQSRHYLEQLRRQFRFSSSVYNDPQGRSGGLALWWTEDVHISLFELDKFFFDGCCSTTNYALSWHFTFVYGESNTQFRRSMWNRVMGMRRNMSIPWLLMGDLNLVGDSADKRGKRPPTVLDRVILNELMAVCSLREIGFKGSSYTWTNGRQGSENTSERLDRALMNDTWHQLYPNAQLFHCTRMGSNHCPLMLCQQAIPKKYKRRFRFELKWQLHDGYPEVIYRGWTTDKLGSPLFTLSSKLHNLKKHL